MPGVPRDPPETPRPPAGCHRRAVLRGDPAAIRLPIARPAHAVTRHRRVLDLGIDLRGGWLLPRLAADYPARGTPLASIAPHSIRRFPRRASCLSLPLCSAALS